MKRDWRGPWIVVTLCALWVAAGLRAPAVGEPFLLTRFGQLPVLEGGRIKPLDTVARTALLLLRGKQTVRVDPRSLPATVWLADMLFRAEVANQYRVFE